MLHQSKLSGFFSLKFVKNLAVEAINIEKLEIDFNEKNIKSQNK